MTLLAVGLSALVAGIVAWGYVRTGNFPGELQRPASLSLATAVLEQALVPLWAAMLASWVAVLRIAPRLDGDWRTLGANQRARIPGALDAGTHIGTKTYLECFLVFCTQRPSDIAQDFRIDPMVSVVVPPGA